MRTDLGDQGQQSGRSCIPSLPYPQPGRCLAHTGARASPVRRCGQSAWHLTAGASLLQVLSEPWRLSTSQIAQFQIRMFDPNKYPNHLGAGGGFGPVADDGYGVSYMIAGENTIFFHVSSKFSSSETNAQRFGNHIRQALLDLADLFQVPKADS